MARFRHLILVCTNRRDPTDKRGSCAMRGGEELADRLKTLVEQAKLKGKVRVVKTGCLDYCVKGCTVAVFSDDPMRHETWYTHATPADADELFRTHVLDGTRLERLVEPAR